MSKKLRIRRDQKQTNISGYEKGFADGAAKYKKQLEEYKKQHSMLYNTTGIQYDPVNDPGEIEIVFKMRRIEEDLFTIQIPGIRIDSAGYGSTDMGDTATVQICLGCDFTVNLPIAINAGDT